MRTHSVKVADRVISYPFNDRAIARNVKADQLSVEFDDEWKATTSALAVFAGSGTVVRVAISAASGKATVAIPWECLREGGKLHVSFVGYLAGDARIVTEKMSRPFLVAEGGEVDGGSAAAASPDVVQAALADASKAASAANAAAGSANTAASAANTAASKASAEAGNLSGLKTSCESATKAASEAAASASTAAGKAAQSATKADTAAQGANDAKTEALKAAEEARGSISPDKRLYIAYDTVGDTDYISLVDTED